MLQLRRTTLAVVLIALTVSGGALGQRKMVTPGEMLPEHDFSKFLNGDGRTKTSDFIGQPVLLEWWGTK